MSKWQPIENARTGAYHPYEKQPEYKVDAAEFLLVWNGYHRGVAYGLDTGEGVCWWDEGGDPVEPPPTHFMPLPDPPEAD